MQRNGLRLSLSVLALLWLILQAASARQQPDATLVDSALAEERPAAGDTLFMPVVAYWALGEVRTIEFVKGRREYEDGARISADSTVTVYRVSVIDSTEDSYRVRWMATASETTHDLLEDVQLDEALLRGLAEEGVIVRTSELGELQEVENMEALKVVLRAVLDSTIAVVIEQDTTGMFDDHEARQGLRAFTESLLSNEFLSQQLLGTFQLYYMWYGYEYPVGVETHYDELLPNPFGGNPLPASGIVVMQEVDWDAYTGTMRSTLNLKPGAMDELMQTMMDMAGQTGLFPADSLDAKRAEMEAEMAGVTMDVNDVNRYVIDFDSGWVLSLDRVRVVEVVEAGTKRREDFLRFTLLD